MTIANAQINQPDLFLTTKLQPPSSIHPLVSRSRLLQRLEQGLEEKLTLICAPAGSGKTTLCIDWLRDERSWAMPVAWVSLDEGDNDLERFWHYVCLALAQIRPDIGEQLSHMLQAPARLMNETLLIHLINLLAEAEAPFVLVLDDYHLVATESIHQALAFLLDRMPAQMHLVLLTRFEPPLALPRLRVRGQVIEIREVDLRFTVDEVGQFFSEAMRFPLAPAHIQALTQRTEGWIAGLHLAALAWREWTDSDTFFVTSFTGSSRYIIDYFLEEVIERQSAEVQRFLFSTAVLGRMCSSLCASVLADEAEPREDNPQDFNRWSQELLEYLERTNLFLVPLDHQRCWYRYHPLFAEALQARLDLLYPALRTTFHLRASMWYEQQGLLSEAIEQALASREVLRVCALLEQVASASALKVGNWTLLSWLKTVPEAEIRSRPRLCLLLAQAERQAEDDATARTQALAAALWPLPKGSSQGSLSKPQPLLDPLSERELEVLHLMAVGEPNVSIAQQLVIAPTTVKRHLSNIFSKLAVANRTQAAAQARTLGIL